MEVTEPGPAAEDVAYEPRFAAGASGPRQRVTFLNTADFCNYTSCSDGMSRRNMLGQHFSPFPLPSGFLGGAGGEQLMVLRSA